MLHRIWMIYTDEIGDEMRWYSLYQAGGGGAKEDQAEHCPRASAGN